MDEPRHHDSSRRKSLQPCESRMFVNTARSGIAPASRRGLKPDQSRWLRQQSALALRRLGDLRRLCKRSRRSQLLRPRRALVQVRQALEHDTRIFIQQDQPRSIHHIGPAPGGRGLIDISTSTRHDLRHIVKHPFILAIPWTVLRRSLSLAFTGRTTLYLFSTRALGSTTRTSAYTYRVKLREDDTQKVIGRFFERNDSAPWSRASTSR